MTENKRTSLSREDWLQKALDFLATEGQARLRIDSLVKHLGVTKGSFYHHFRDRQEFVHAVVEYWDQVSTRAVAMSPAVMSGTPEERLWALMEVIQDSDLGRYDIFIRSWAARDAGVREQLVKVERFRLNFVRSLFAEMGFKGMELEARSRTFAGAMSAERSIVAKLTDTDRGKLMREQHRLFTRS